MLLRRRFCLGGTIKPRQLLKDQYHVVLPILDGHAGGDVIL